MDHLVFLSLNYYSLTYPYICTDYQDTTLFYIYDEILGIIEGKYNINTCISLPIAGKVHRFSRLSIDGAIDGERNIVNNNLRLTFTPSMTLLKVLKHCNDISCQHFPPFVSFINVSSRL